MLRPIINRVFELREWQCEARHATRQKYQTEKDFLAVATPGSGKTKYGLIIAYELLQEKLVDRIVVVTPSENLKRQWAAEAAHFAGIDLDPDFTNSQGMETTDFHGIAVTYALLAQDKKGVHVQNTFNSRTFVIFDEPHHMGDNLSWGAAALKAFEGAIFRLLISGTPFRSDDAQIPFVTYDEGISKADYTYSYERSIKDNVCRPVYFTVTDGRMKWKVDKLEFEHTFTDHLEPDQVSKRLKTALDPKGNYTREVMRAADNKLSEIRYIHPDAAGLVFCMTQHHAKEITSMIEELTGNAPPIVISEDSDGNEKIERFKHSGGRWLVSVKMVSEGIDIPRLRVGVYFTIVKAELFFRQAVGRFVRVQKELKEQEAYIFIPQDKDIVKLAETIQEEREHALEDAKKADPNSGSTDKDLWGNDYIPALQGKFQMMGAEAITNKTIAVAVEITRGARYGIDHRRIEETNPVYIQKEIIRKRLNDHAKHYALKLTNRDRSMRPDFKAAHKLWMEQGGKSMDIETIEELNQREIFYIQLLRSH